MSEIDPKALEIAAAAVDASWSDEHDRGPSFAETERSYQNHCRDTARAAVKAYLAATNPPHPDRGGPKEALNAR